MSHLMANGLWNGGGRGVDEDLRSLNPTVALPEVVEPSQPCRMLEVMGLGEPHDLRGRGEVDVQGDRLVHTQLISKQLPREDVGGLQLPDRLRVQPLLIPKCRSLQRLSNVAPAFDNLASHGRRGDGSG